MEDQPPRLGVEVGVHADRAPLIVTPLCTPY